MMRCLTEIASSSNATYSQQPAAEPISTADLRCSSPECPFNSTQMKGRFPKKIGGQLFLFFFFFLFFLFFVFLALFGLFISFLFSFNLLERLKRSAFQRRPRMIPCLLAAAAMVMRYGRLCAEKRSGHVHYLPSPYHAPHPLQMPAGASGAPNEHHRQRGSRTALREKH